MPFPVAALIAPDFQASYNATERTDMGYLINGVLEDAIAQLRVRPPVITTTLFPVYLALLSLNRTLKSGDLFGWSGTA